jgi:hypothetical protein
VKPIRHPLVALPASSKSFHYGNCATAASGSRSPKAPLMGFFPLQHSEASGARIPRKVATPPAPSVLRVWSLSRRLASPKTLRAFFHARRALEVLPESPAPRDLSVFARAGSSGFPLQGFLRSREERDDSRVRLSCTFTTLDDPWRDARDIRRCFRVLLAGEAAFPDGATKGRPAFLRFLALRRHTREYETSSRSGVTPAVADSASPRNPSRLLWSHPHLYVAASRA